MSMPLKIMIVIAAALFAFAVLHWGRGLPPTFAGLIAFAIGALMYSILRTVERLRTVYRKPQGRRWPPE